MERISFVRDAGLDLFGKDNADEMPDTGRRLEENAAQAIRDYIGKLGLAAEGLEIGFDSAIATVTVSGMAPDHETREKIVLCCGNVQGVEQVDDRLEIEDPDGPEYEWHTVKKGESLPNIAQYFFTDANKYMDIFEANRPMMAHPDRVYPGQMLRIPPARRRCFEPTVLMRRKRPD